MLEKSVDPEDMELDDLLSKMVQRLRQARGNPAEVRVAIDLYLVEGESQERSPAELRDYFDISSPGLAEQAGYTEPEQEEASRLFDEVSQERYGGTTS